MNIDRANGEGSAERDLGWKLTFEADESNDDCILIRVDRFCDLHGGEQEGWHGFPKQGHCVSGGGEGVEMWTEGLRAERMSCDVVLMFVCHQGSMVEAEMARVRVPSHWGRGRKLGDGTSLALYETRAA